jgi:hypothetical protein
MKMFITAEGLGAQYVAVNDETKQLSIAVRAMNKEQVILFGTNRADMAFHWTGKTKPPTPKQLETVKVIQRLCPSVKLMSVLQTFCRIWWILRGYVCYASMPVWICYALYDLT